MGHSSPSDGASTGFSTSAADGADPFRVAMAAQYNSNGPMPETCRTLRRAYWLWAKQPIALSYYSAEV
jgi:hypothetical protein